MDRKISWGIMSTANIGVNLIIPAMQKSNLSQVTAIASRNREKAEQTASRLGISKSYGSYTQLLADDSIEAVYIPLPNHMHREWMIKAMQAGKHVLCEKPLCLDVKDIKDLIKVRNRCGVKAAEAFMVRVHPQWEKAKEIISSGKLGTVRGMNCHFSYCNTDPADIRNIAEYGGGAVWDIGCYPVHCSRFLTGRLPSGVSAVLNTDPDFGTDCYSVVLLDYDEIKCSFSVSTQSANYQRFFVYGEKMNMEIAVPFNAPIDRPCRINLYKADILSGPAETIEIPVCNQYSLQADSFSRAIIDDSEVHVPLEDALEHAAVLKAVFYAAAKKKKINPRRFL